VLERRSRDAPPLPRPTSISENANGVWSAFYTLRREVERMTPRELVRRWVEAFNREDVDALASMYAEDAVNHQVAESAVVGREAIRRMFAEGFAAARMVCIVENLFEEGEWAILEWRDPLGLRGCGFFRIVGGRIAFQRGYWDKLSFLRAHGLPLPDRA
jgi:limonene-1,2-epoxide hydrolase